MAREDAPIKKDNTKLRSRLENWKFEQATQYLKGESHMVKAVVRALARSYGDPGWFEGDQGTIVAAALDCIGMVEEEKP